MDGSWAVTEVPESSEYCLIWGIKAQKCWSLVIYIKVMKLCPALGQNLSGYRQVLVLWVQLLHSFKLFVLKKSKYFGWSGLLLQQKNPDHCGCAAQILTVGTVEGAAHHVVAQFPHRDNCERAAGGKFGAAKTWADWIISTDDTCFNWNMA